MKHYPGKELHVDSLAISVKYVSDKEIPGSLGQYTAKGGIHIDRDLPADSAANVFIHEVLHVLLVERGVSSILEGTKGLEEAVVTCLAGGMLQVLKDNPEWTSWLLINVLEGSPEDYKWLLSLLRKRQLLTP